MFIFCCYTGLAYNEMSNLEAKHRFDQGRAAAAGDDLADAGARTAGAVKARSARQDLELRAVVPHIQ